MTGAGLTEKKACDRNENFLNGVGGQAERLEGDGPEHRGGIRGADEARSGQASAVDRESHLGEGKIEPAAIGGPDGAGF